VSWLSQCPYHALIKFLGFRKPPHHIDNTISLNQTNVSGGHIRVEDSSQMSIQMNMIDLTDVDLNIIRAIKPLMMERMDQIVDSFYQSVIDVENLEDIINDHSSIERLRLTLRDHLIELFDGQINLDFINKRLRIAEIHHHIGLEPKWYMGAFQNLQNAFMDVVFQNVSDNKESLIISKAITKLLNFEQQLVLEAYEQKNIDQRMEHELIKQQLKEKFLLVTEELAALTEQTNASVQELMATSTNVNYSVNNSAKKANDSKSLAITGSSQISKLSEQINSINESSRLMGDRVGQLIDSSQKIKNVITIVAEISSQINLLSLNAAIEAARAGEHGKGFSVVSSEIRKLSEDTNNAVKQISELIQQTNTFTDQVGGSIGEVQKLVAKGQQGTSETREVFDNIGLSLESGLLDIEKVRNEIGALVMAIEEIGAATIKVASTTENLNQTTQNL
jgi:heme-based aerotactic transducer